MLNRNRIKADLQALGLRSGTLVMLHASVRAVGKIVGGPDEILHAIMEVISPTGTLMMYVECEPEFEIVGRGKLSLAEEEFLLENCPAFNPATTRARRSYGVLAEFFRSWPGVECSANPGARIAAWGEKSTWLTTNHPLKYGYGLGSPLAKLYDSQGKILLLGSDLDQVTLLHYAEDIAPIAEKRIVRCKVPLLKNNQRVWTDVEEYDTSVGIRQWPPRFFATLIMQFINDYAVQAIKVGNATSYLLDAKKLVDFAVPKFVEAAKKYPC